MYTTKTHRGYSRVPSACGQRQNNCPGKPKPQRFPRISQPVELIQDSYDCVVIGSGYGGGIAASRMARTGQSVCVLERGQERWPGEYPVCLKQVFDEFHTTGSSIVRPFGRGKPTGMYHIVAGQGQSALVCNGMMLPPPFPAGTSGFSDGTAIPGLGGTSLINANVFLEADDATLSMDTWPPEIRENPGCLKECWSFFFFFLKKSDAYGGGLIHIV